MLDRSLHFLKFLREFEKVERAVYRPTDRKENDAEHSYQTTMMAWFLAHQFDLPLSTEKILQYALVHDLVEVYAGDTPVFSEKNSHDKKERERGALEKIKDTLSHFPELIDTIEQYEQKSDPESVFVYEIDKLIPAFNIYIDNGYGWNKLGVTLDQIKKEKVKKVKNTKELVNLLEELLDRLEKEREQLFED